MSFPNLQNKQFLVLILTIIGLSLCSIVNLYSQERDSIFSNSLFYNGFYDDDSFIDSNYIFNLVHKIKTSDGESKVELLFKLLNGYYFSNPELAKDLSKKALDHALETQNDSLIAFAYHYHALSYIYLDYPKLSNLFYKKGLATKYSKRKADYRSWVNLNMGENYVTLEKYDIAAKHYYEALNLNNIVGDNDFAAKVYEDLSQLFFITGNYSESIKNNFLAINLLDKEKDKRIIAELFIQRFKISFAENKIDSANYFFNRAIENGRELNDSLLITEIYSEFGEELFIKKLYSKSLEAFEKGRSYCNSNIFEVKYYSLLHGIGKSNLFLGNTEIAKKELLLAKNAFQELSVSEKLQKLELSLAQLYAKLGDWQNYIIHSNNAEKYRLSLLKEHELRTINELQIAYETEKKDEQIRYQLFQIGSQERQIWLIGSVAFVTLLGLMIALFLSRKLKFANKNLIDKNLELSERWNQLQKFYGSAESNLPNTSQNELFHRIYQLMVKEQIYTKADITVDYLSKQLSSNTKYISKAIKEETGMNFNTFINTFRIEEAKRILRDKISSTWSLDAVAEQSGFNNTTSFFQAFKKNTGLTPSAFRNALVTSLLK